MSAAQPAFAASAAPRLSCKGLGVAVAGRTLVRNLDLAIPGGSITAVLGCNGAGKTMTLHTLAGLRAPAEGAVMLDAKPLASRSRRALARSVGLLTQTSEDPFPSTVLETVLIGRHPHIGFWHWESETDQQIASAALACVDLTEFAQRDVATLSGGERRRVAIATLLAQNPDVMLLDEPINHLDPHHQIDVLRLLRAKAQAGHAILMSLHDAGLAARFSDQALLLFGDGEWLSGPTSEVLTESSITRLYGLPVREIAWAGGRTFVAE
jgi:iron complex transport system ATP-binding protein